MLIKTIAAKFAMIRTNFRTKLFSLIEIWGYLTDFSIQIYYVFMTIC